MREKEKSAFKIKLSLEGNRHTDIVLTYRSYFNSPRILPKGYIKGIIPLIERAMDYFKDDIDVISHLSGLELRLKAGKKQGRHHPARWQQLERDVYQERQEGRWYPQGAVQE